MFKGISRLLKDREDKKKEDKKSKRTVLDIVSDDQEALDGCRLALHDICIRYDCPGMDALVHEAWRQLCGKLMDRLDGTNF